MAFLENSHMPGSGGLLAGKTDKWFCHVCRNGLAVVKGRELSPYTLVSSGSPSILLLGGEPEDITVAEPPLGLVLTDQEVDWIRAAGAAAIAATWYGPAEQTKSSNQDFAVSARLRDFAGKECVFAAVADGVTTKTFWAARTARLACLTALQVTAAAVVGRGIRSDTDLSRLRGVLAQSLRIALNQDREILIKAHAKPDDWSPDIYTKNIENEAYWYNSTLLLSLLGDNGGFVLFAGDGGIHVTKRAGGLFTDPLRLLTTNAELEISSFASLSVTEADFRAAWLSNIESFDCVEVALATDGVDRTLSVGGGSDDYDTLNLSSSTSALAELKRLGMLPRREVDNYSIARLTWPPSAAPIGPRRGGIMTSRPEKKAETSLPTRSCPQAENGQPTPPTQPYPPQFNGHARLPWLMGVIVSSFLFGVVVTLVASIGFFFTWAGHSLPWTQPLGPVGARAPTTVPEEAAIEKVEAPKVEAPKVEAPTSRADLQTGGLPSSEE